MVSWSCRHSAWQFKRPRMDVGRFTAFIVLVVIASNVSDASLAAKLRKLVGEAPQANSTAKISPVPGPVPGGGKSDFNSSGVAKPQNNNTIDSTENPKSGKDTIPVSPPAEKPTSNGKEKGDDGVDSQVERGEGCKQSAYRCTDNNTMTACVESLKSGSRKMILRVQNEGESTLKAKLVLPAYPESGLKTIDIPAHKIKTLPISTDRSSKIVVDAGDGECVIHIAGSLTSRVNHLLQFSSYSELVMPVNGAYLMLCTLMVFGGTWGLCKLGRRRRDHGGGGVYRELEMGFPESGSGLEGWDQGWDDDWAEDANGPVVGNVSANGLTSRSSNKNGWENDWGD